MDDTLRRKAVDGIAFTKVDVPSINTIKAMKGFTEGVEVRLMIKEGTVITALKREQNILAKVIAVSASTGADLEAIGAPVSWSTLSSQYD